MFLSEAQQRYVEQYCLRLRAALAADQDGEHIIDMDAVADAVGKDGRSRPSTMPRKASKSALTVRPVVHSMTLSANFATVRYAGLAMIFMNWRQTRWLSFAQEPTQEADTSLRLRHSRSLRYFCITIREAARPASAITLCQKITP